MPHLNNTPRRPTTSQNNSTTNNNTVGSALPKNLQQPPVPQPPPWSAKRIRPIEHHASAFQKSALESFEQELLASDRHKSNNPYYHKNLSKRPATTSSSAAAAATGGSQQNNQQNQQNQENNNNLKIGEKEIRDKDSWQTLSTMTHHSEEAALAAIRRIFVAANLRRKKHLEAVARRDAKAEKLESAGDRVLLSLGIDPRAPTIGIPKQKPIIDPLIRCMQDTTFLGDLIAIQSEILANKSVSDSKNNNSSKGQIVGGGTREEFQTVIPEEFWVFEDTPLIGSIGLDEDIVASEERVSEKVPESQRSSHTTALSSRVFPSRGSRCAESRVEVYYLANALDTMIQRYLQHNKGVFPRYPSAAELQEREETLFDVVMCGMRELVRHNAARTIERGRVLERLRLAIESLWESRKVTLDKAQAEIRSLYDVNDPTKFVDLERLVETQALEIEQLKESVSELKEQNEILKGMDSMLRLARDKEKAVSEYLTRQAARNVTLSRLQQQIEMDMSEFEQVLNEEQHSSDDASVAMANLLRGVSQLNDTLKGSDDSNNNTQRSTSPSSSPPQQSSSTTRNNRAAGFAPVLDINSQDPRLQRRKSFSSLARKAFAPSESQQRRRLSRHGSGMNFGIVDGVDGSVHSAATSESSPSFARFNKAVEENEEKPAVKVDTRDFTVQCNMDRSYDREIMESIRSLLETVGTQLHVADKLTQTFYGSEVNKDKDPIGHKGAHMLKELTRKTLQMEAALREAAVAPTDAITLANQFSTLYPVDSSQHLIFNKENFSLMIQTCFEASREVHIRLNALSRHPGVVNAVDPLMPPTSPDQPCTLCGRTVLRRAEEGEDELKRAIEEIEQLSASLERAHLEKEMFKEEILRSETRLRRKGIPTMVDAETDVDPELDKGRKLSPQEEREKAEFSARCVLKAVKAFRNLIFVDGDFVQQRRKVRNRRRTLLIAGSNSIKLHKAASMFQKAGSMRRTNSSMPNRSPSSNALNRSLTRDRSPGSPASSGRGWKAAQQKMSSSLNNKKNNQQSPTKNNNNDQDGNQSSSPSNKGKFIETGAFDGEGSVSWEETQGSSTVFGSFRRGNSNRSLTQQRASPSSATSKSPSPRGNNTSASSKSPSPSKNSTKNKNKNNTNISSPLPSSSSSPKLTIVTPPHQHIKPLVWVLKSFFGALLTFAKEDSLAIKKRRESSVRLHQQQQQLLQQQQLSNLRSPSRDGARTPLSRNDSLAFTTNSGDGILTSNNNNNNNNNNSNSNPSTPQPGSTSQPTGKRRRTLSGTLAMMSQQQQQQFAATAGGGNLSTSPSFLGDPTTESGDQQQQQNPNLMSGSIPDFGVSFDFESIADSVQTMEDALEEYFKQQLGTKTLVEESIQSFHASWPKYVKEDPRVTVIEKMFEGISHNNGKSKKSTTTTNATKAPSRSTQSLMLYVVASLHKTLDSMCEEYGESKHGDEDARHPASVPLIQALTAFHAVCGSSSFFSVGVEHLIMYSSTNLYYSPSAMNNNNNLRSATSSVTPAASPLMANFKEDFDRSPKTPSAGSKHSSGFLESHHMVEKKSNAFFSTPAAQNFLPPDYQSRRILRSRVLLLAMLLEKAVSQKNIISSTVSGIFSSSMTGGNDSSPELGGSRKSSLFLTAMSGSPSPSGTNNNNNSKQEDKSFFRTALGEFADCCGKADISDPGGVASSSRMGGAGGHQRKSFAESFSSFLQGQ